MDEIIVLQTYNPNETASDGLSVVFDKVRHVGRVTHDTSGITGAKVIVCGIPFLYEERLSPHNFNIIYTTFESSHLPPFWVNSLNDHYRHCIVPHTAIRSVFRESGVSIPISVIHQGFIRHIRLERMPLESESFAVGFLGVPTARKNFNKIYEACRKLKGNDIPGISLHIHCASFYEWMDESRFTHIKNDKMVKWTQGKYDGERLADWYSSLSCYIFPSSGEGWSFTPRESLYLKVPTIVSDIPVHKELVTSGFCRVIPGDGMEKANFEGKLFGEWTQITEEKIAQAILDVYRNYSHYLSLAAKGARWIETQWRNEDVQHKLCSLIHKL